MLRHGRGALVVLLVVAGACGGDDAPTAADRDDGGTVELGTTDVPDEWPADIPFPDGFRPTDGSTIGDGAGSILVAVSGTMPGTLADFESFYDGALDGWEESLRNRGDHVELGFSYTAAG